MSSIPTTKQLTLTPLERLLGLFTHIEAREGRGVALLSGYAFVLLLAYYLLRPVREALILGDGSAELRSYTTGVIALVLMGIVPGYAMLCRRWERTVLVRAITMCFMVSLAGFALLGFAGVRIGIAFFIWLGVFGVLSLAQFWAYATDLYSPGTGHRLFPLIATGATAGAWLGSQVSGGLFALAGPFGLMLIACGALGVTLFLAGAAGRRLASRNRQGRASTAVEPISSGFMLIWRDPFLRLIALSVVLLNWITAMGDYVLAESVLNYAAQATGAGMARQQLISEIYGRFYASVALLTFLLQILLVARVLRAIGVRGALLVLPILMLMGYGLLAFVPVFSVLRLFKVLESAGNYSLQNTTRHALFLPVGQRAKYEGQTAIESFFWRLGDLIQAITVYAGVRWLTMDARHFICLNMLLSLLLLAVSSAVGRRHAALARDVVARRPPARAATGGGALSKREP